MKLNLFSTVDFTQGYARMRLLRPGPNGSTSNAGRSMFALQTHFVPKIGKLGRSPLRGSSNVFSAATGCVRLSCCAPMCRTGMLVIVTTFDGLGTYLRARRGFGG